MEEIQRVPISFFHQHVTIFFILNLILVPKPLNQASAERRRPRRPGFPNSLFPSWDSSFLSQKVAHQPRKSWTKFMESMTTSWTETRASKIQDGLRSPALDKRICEYLTLKIFRYRYLLKEARSKISPGFKIVVFEAFFARPSFSSTF